MDDIQKAVLREIDILEGNLNRMCVTNDFTELVDMYAWSCKRICNAFDLNRKRIAKKVELDYKCPKCGTNLWKVGDQK